MENKKIVGLDVGTSSIGWAVINEGAGQQPKILGMGSRIMPLATDENSLVLYAIYQRTQSESKSQP